MAKKKSKNKAKAAQKGSGFSEFIRSEQFARLRGACYVLFALFSAVALISYFVTTADQDGNWLGKLGFLTSEFFAKNLFGIGSLGISLLFFVYGLRLWKVELLPWWKTFWSTLFWMVWLSTVLGYICGTWVKNPQNLFIFEDYAGLGVIFAGVMDRLVHWGTLIVMVFIACVFLIFVHKVKFIKEMPSHLKDSSSEPTQEKTQENTSKGESEEDPFASFQDLLKNNTSTKQPVAQPTTAETSTAQPATEPVTGNSQQESATGNDSVSAPEPSKRESAKEKKKALSSDMEPQLIHNGDPTRPRKVLQFVEKAASTSALEPEQDLEAEPTLEEEPANDGGNHIEQEKEGDATSTLAATPSEENTQQDSGVEFEGEGAFDIDATFERVMQRAKGVVAEPEFTIHATESFPGETANEGNSPEQENIPEGKAEVERDEDVGNVHHEHHGLDELYDPHLDLRDYQMPETDLLENWEKRNTMVTKEELVSNKDRIVSTLRDYGIEITEISASPGPTVTLYEIKPAPGIRISKIKNLEDDIALSLSAMGIRIIAPIPGKGTVGIEVPNTNPQIVSMKTMLESEAFKSNTKMELPIAFGKTISNEPFVTDLVKMPHLLMAGATGTGKSVGLNAVIASLLYKKHPSELKFVMVDPKKVELSIYNKIERHYLAKLPDSDEAIITDVRKVVRTLNSLCIEMDQRYDLLKAAGARKITEYNDKFMHRHLNPLTEVTPGNSHRFLPYIVLIVDEFADLIMTAGKEVELPICRLAQLARAVGIHLIIATQRPTTNIITGTIKANFPARVAFKVTSAIDSRTILDAGGAQRLIGRGDMLISLSGSDLIRLQCALMETEECEKLSHFIGEQRGYPDGFMLPEYLDENEEPNKDFDPKQKDEFFNDAARLVVASQFGSTSLLQRKLGLGYNRAGRVIDQLEAAGIVGPHNGSKPRDVLVHDDVTLEEILKSL